MTKSDVLEWKIINTLRDYLQQCKEDDEDRWIMREVLHNLMNDYDKEIGR